MEKRKELENAVADCVRVARCGTESEIEGLCALWGAWSSCFEVVDGATWLSNAFGAYSAGACYAPGSGGNARGWAGQKRSSHARVQRRLPLTAPLPDVFSSSCLPVAAIRWRDLCSCSCTCRGTWDWHCCTLAS